MSAENIPQKLCNHCKTVKPISKFHHRKEGRNGYAPICAECNRRNKNIPHAKIPRGDLTGQRFLRLAVLEYIGSRKAHGYYKCLCDCGKTIEARADSLRDKTTQSCGCYRLSPTNRLSRKHGCRNTEEYKIWTNMRVRCRNPKYSRYMDYGGRGIKVDQRWDDFSNFLADMGRRPSKNHTLDRIDNNGDYSPDNCRWATRIQQANNKRNSHYITYKGKTMTIPEWTRYLNFKPSLIRNRIRKGWSIERALTEPVH